MSLEGFHPAVQSWFERTFTAPTAVQRDAWAAITEGQHTLIAAPTGSGKTLAAFLTAIDSLVRQASRGYIDDAVQVVYVSPLKALSNDVERNLQLPLAGITEVLLQQGSAAAEIRAQVRTGDTPQHERMAMRRRPPHILVTTPESLYLLLTSGTGREMLATTRTVIVDEIHAVASSKRGAHLALSLERLSALCPQPVQRIGLSATQKPIEEIANFLVGSAVPLQGHLFFPSPSGRGQGEGDSEILKEDQSTLTPTLSLRERGPEEEERQEEERQEEERQEEVTPSRNNCVIVNTGHVRERDIQLVLPDAPLEAVMSNDVWTNVYDKLSKLIDEHHTTLVFANTRRMVERVARQLTERLGEVNVAAHHGSLSKETRFDAEQRLKAGNLRVLVATASLELGIDIGDVDLVCQLASPRSIAAFLQRVGRANHSVTGVPRGRLFPLSRDELVECTALLDAVRQGELDRLVIPDKPLDVLAQQMVAEVASREYGEDELYTQVTRAWPYRNLQRDEFDDVLRMLSDGLATRRGRQSAYLHHDAVNQRVRARKGAKLTALTCGGAIPDNADYRVILEPQEIFVGTLNEDFAVESLAGDIFQLGNASYRILRVEAGKVRVEDAKGQPPTLPFWLGEAPARSDELSQAVSRLRAQVNAALEPDRSRATTHNTVVVEGSTSVSANNIDESRLQNCIDMLMREHDVSESVARQLTDYLGAAKAMLGNLPTQQRLVFERFFDESGGMQMVIHSPFGARVNRAYGLSLRKRFCRSFNFELQAAATEDAVILSLGESHSFDLAEVARYLNSNTVRELLIQAMLDSPLFTTRWRWVSSIALAVQRYRGGKRTPAPLQRMAAEDLISMVFPQQLACIENIQGDREVPDHPLVNQAIHDCLYEAMDVEGLQRLLQGLEQGDIEVVACDLPMPSPLSQEILTAKPYAFLDDAPLEERRTQAVASRRWLDPQSAAEFGKLDERAIAQVREEAWPSVDNADELHDALMSMSMCSEVEAQRSGWQVFFDQLLQQGRVTVMSVAASASAVKSTLTPTLSLREREVKGESMRAPSASHVAVETSVTSLPSPLGGRSSASMRSRHSHILCSGGQGEGDSYSYPYSDFDEVSKSTLTPTLSLREREPEVALSDVAAANTSIFSSPSPLGRGQGEGNSVSENVDLEVSDTSSSLPSPGCGRGAGGEGAFVADDLDEENALSLTLSRNRERESEGALHRYWLAAERMPVLATLYPAATFSPPVKLPESLTTEEWHADTALVELLRGRLQASGPVTAQRLVGELQLPLTAIDMALLQLETQGFAMRGQFTSDTSHLEWCERRLLARIHRYTVQSLRAEIEPVSAADFMRFLLQWQGVIREPRPQGVEALAGIVEQLEGIEVPAAAWEGEVLPARMHEYDPNWLDSVCLSGRALWLRLQASTTAAAPVRATPIVLLTRKNVPLWQSAITASEDELQLSHAAQRIREYLQQHGASFFADIQHGSGLLQSQAEEGLSELVSAGLLSADSFSGLRALVLPMDRKRKLASRGMRIASFGLEDAGRWSLVRRNRSVDSRATISNESSEGHVAKTGILRQPQDEQKKNTDASIANERLTQLAFILLRRYGVVFRKLLVHESTQLPRWHELLRVFRQLEAQGLIRGGRFVAGVTGEQYALPEAVSSLRGIRKQALDGKLISLSAADPLNLSGALIPGPRIPALAGNRLLLRDGELVASYVGGQSQLHVSFTPADEWTARNVLLHKRIPGASQPALGMS
jgi:Lhr-like helicase